MLSLTSHLHCRQHLQKDPGHVQAAFWLAALTPGPQVSACPPEIVSKLFDGYSHHFDDHLVNKLGYKTPGKLM
jgi:predicted TPR repeat methyltransferase